jgi:hypothetical protein
MFGAFPTMPILAPTQREQLQNWLSEIGELYVDVHRPHSGSSGTAYFLLSVDELETLVVDETSPELVVTVFRHLQYPLRGVADSSLLAQALQQIPDGEWFHIVSLEDRFPSPCWWRGSGNTHRELRDDFGEVLGQRVGIGQDPFDRHPTPFHFSPDEVLVFTRERKVERA